MAEGKGTNRVLDMYGEFRDFIHDVENKDFYAFFLNSLTSSPMTLSVFEKYTERRIDERWLAAIEDAIIPLDMIIRNPNRFIKREENVVPIEMARDIGPESVRHLSQHTNLIARVEGDTVTPNKILNIIKEESFDTYENRFIYTLLKQLTYFLDKRMLNLLKNTKSADTFEYSLDGNCKIGSDDVKYHFNMSFDSPHEEVEGEREKLLKADVSQMTPLQRIERLRKILYTFQASAFCREMAGSVPVRPPLVMTNVLKKNPNFVKCVSLWSFINAYTEQGYTTNYIEQYRSPSIDDRNEMFAILMLQYVMMKKQTKRIYDSGEASKAEVPHSAPNIVSRLIEELSSSFDLTIDEVRRIFEKEMRKKEKKREADFAKARGIFERAIIFEKEVKQKKETERRERIVNELKRRFKMAQKEEAQVLREEKERRIAAEKAAEEERRRIEAEKRAEEERARLEAERIAEEKRIEKERLEAERLEAERKYEIERAERYAADKAKAEAAKAKHRKYDGMGRKKKKAAQKIDGVYELEKREKKENKRNNSEN